jgi:opacity protein-like surface antigen
MAIGRFHRFAALYVAIASVSIGASLFAAESSFVQSYDNAAVAPAVTETLAPNAESYLSEATPVSYDAALGSSSAPGRSCDRWYLGLSGGWQERETVHEVGDPLIFIEFDSGFAVNAQLGYRFDVFRIEAEMTFMNNGAARAGAAGFDTPTSGNVNLRAYMVNIYHDFQLFDWLWEPYVGAGIGIYQSELNGLYPDFFDSVPGGSFIGQPINATSNMPLAYQFRAGVSRPIGRRTELYSGYRYFRGENLTFASAPFAAANAHTFEPDGAEIHNLEVGLRVRF